MLEKKKPVFELGDLFMFIFVFAVAAGFLATSHDFGRMCRWLSTWILFIYCGRWITQCISSKYGDKRRNYMGEMISLITGFKMEDRKIHRRYHINDILKLIKWDDEKECECGSKSFEMNTFLTSGVKMIEERKFKMEEFIPEISICCLGFGKLTKYSARVLGIVDEMGRFKDITDNKDEQELGLR